MPPVRRLVRRSFLDRRSLGEGGSEGGSLGEVGSVVKISVLENESTFGKRYKRDSTQWDVWRGGATIFGEGVEPEVRRHFVKICTLTPV